LIVAAAALLALAPTGSAYAAPYTVDSTADLPDVALDGVCADTNSDCTLRAAIQEANNSAAVADTISFSAGFDGTDPSGTIAIGSNLPSITDPVTIDGGDCGATADSEPCAGIEGTSGLNGLDVATGGAGSSIRNLTFSNLTFGITLSGGSVDVTGSWFGIDLDESTTSNGLADGVLINNVSSGNEIGDGTAAGRNLFAQNVQAGVLIQAGDNNTVVGNYFGTNRAGASPGGGFVNGDAIHIFGSSAGPNDATGNVVGGPDTAGNTACDGDCNLIANVSDDGIDLSDDFPPGNAAWIPADSTTISGNYIGLAVDGTDGDLAGGSSGLDGIEFSSSSEAASNTTVGGTSAADRNYIGGNPVGVDTGQVADQNTTIQNNYLGVQPDGTGAVSNEIDTLDVSGAVGGSVKVLDNRIGGNGAAGLEGIFAYGRGAVIKGNILGVDTSGTVLPFSGPAIDTQASTNNSQIGGAGAGEGNTIAGGGVAGIRINNGNFNTIQGNFIGTDSSGTASYANTGPGILVTGPVDSAVDTTIGGTTASGENLISNNIGDAIRVTRVDGVEIQRNRGSGNGEEFIDLELPSGPGNDLITGAAEGLQAPQITSFSATSASGTSDPNATIRVFAKASAAAGELGGEVATATADGSGAWTATYTSQPEGQRLVVTQTVPASTGFFPPQTSELSSAVQLPITLAPPPITSPSGTPVQAPKKKCKKGFVKKKVKGKTKCVKKKRKK
jgi:hypothetical protein